MTGEYLVAESGDITACKHPQAIRLIHLEDGFGSQEASPIVSMANARVTYTSTEQAGIKFEICQYQPTDRPIEDRFSVTANEDSTRLVVGVYDGMDSAFGLSERY